MEHNLIARKAFINAAELYPLGPRMDFIGKAFKKGGKVNTFKYHCKTDFRLILHESIEGKQGILPNIHSDFNLHLLGFDCFVT